MNKLVETLDISRFWNIRIFVTMQRP